MVGGNPHFRNTHYAKYRFAENGTLRKRAVKPAGSMNLLDHLRVFAETAHLGSLSAAGRSLGLATSGVSRRIDALEAHFAAALLRRTPRGVVLTDEGRALLARAGRILEEVDALGAAAVGRGAAREISGRLRLTVPSRFGARYVAPLLPAFLRKHPRVEVELSLTDRRESVAGGGYDLAVRIGASDALSEVVRTIARNRRILVASPGYLKTGPPIATPTDLAACDGLMLSESPQWRLVRKGGRGVTVRPRERVRCRQGDVLTELCAGNLGIALKSLWDVHTLLRQGRLVRVLPGWESADSADITIVLPSRLYVPARVRAFLSVLENAIGSPPVWEQDGK